MNSESYNYYVCKLNCLPMTQAPLLPAFCVQLNIESWEIKRGPGDEAKLAILLVSPWHYEYLDCIPQS